MENLTDYNSAFKVCRGNRDDPETFTVRELFLQVHVNIGCCQLGLAALPSLHCTCGPAQGRSVGGGVTLWVIHFLCGSSAPGTGCAEMFSPGTCTCSWRTHKQVQCDTPPSERAQHTLSVGAGPLPVSAKRQLWLLKSFGIGRGQASLFVLSF